MTLFKDWYESFRIDPYKDMEGAKFDMYPVPEDLESSFGAMINAYGKSLPSMQPRIVQSGWWWKKYFKKYRDIDKTLNAIGSYNILNRAYEELMKKMVKEGWEKPVMTCNCWYVMKPGGARITTFCKEHR